VLEEEVAVFSMVKGAATYTNRAGSSTTAALSSTHPHLRNPEWRGLWLERAVRTTLATLRGQFAQIIVTVLLVVLT